MTAPLHPRTVVSDECDLGWPCPLRTERVLLSSVAAVDGVVGGFRSSTSYLIDSESRYASEMLHLMCLRALVELSEEVLWIDGGNAVEPYTLSGMCKRSGLDAHETLSMVNIARAFTAYQLVSLIDDVLNDEAGRCVPAMIIVSSVADMFMDKDLRRSEAHQLLRRCADRIVEVTRERETVTLVTSHTPGRGPPGNRAMSLLMSVFDVAIQVRDRDGAIDIRMPGKGRMARFAPVPWNQTTLNDFDGGFDGENSANIPHRA